MKNNYIILEEHKLIFSCNKDNRNLIFKYKKVNNESINNLNSFIIGNDLSNTSSVIFVHESFDFYYCFNNNIDIMNNKLMLEQHTVFLKIFNCLINNSIKIHKILPLHIIRKRICNNPNMIFVSINNKNTKITKFDGIHEKIIFINNNISLEDYYKELSNRLDISYNKSILLLNNYMINRNSIDREKIIFKINSYQNILFNELETIIKNLNDSFIKIILLIIEKNSKNNIIKNRKLCFEKSLLETIPLDLNCYNDKENNEIFYFDNEYLENEIIINNYCRYNDSIEKKRNCEKSFFSKSCEKILAFSKETLNNISEKSGSTFFEVS